MKTELIEKYLTEDKLVLKIKHNKSNYELIQTVRWGGLVTHIIKKDGKEISQLAPNLDPKIAPKKFKENLKKGMY